MERKYYLHRDDVKMLRWLVNHQMAFDKSLIEIDEGVNFKDTERTQRSLQRLTRLGLRGRVK